MAAVTIGTHSGTFHADESLAIFMLKTLPEYSNATIHRSRDPSVLEKCTILVDVGAVYDPQLLRFDHHQRSFNSTFSNKYTVKLSSAGLIYKHFGKRVLCELLDWKENHPLLDKVYQLVYDELILMFDAVDNGVSQYPDNVEPCYSDSTSISDRVSRLNPSWNVSVGDQELFERFLKAVEITGEELVDKARYIAFSWLPCRDLVFEALKKRKQYDESGRIVVLEQYCPWQSHL